MRFMILIKADKNSEAGIMPSQELLAAMGKFNEELVKAGIMQAGEGAPAQLQGRSRQILRRQAHRHRRPVRRNQELIAGFWMWKCKSKQEAIDWVKRCPNPMPGMEPEIEIRQVFEAEDSARSYA